MLIPRICISVLIVLHIAVCTSAFSQVEVDKDYKKFKDEFKKEVVQYDSSESKTLVLHPAGLPVWFLKIPEPDDDNYYTIGISDPGMEWKEAQKLALLRAKCMYAFMVSPEVTSLADNYSDEKSIQTSEGFVTKYISYFQTHSAIVLNEVELVDSFFTSFNEAIVLAKVLNGHRGNDRLITYGNVYQVERQKTGTFEMEEKHHLYGTFYHGEEDSIGFNYKIYSVNNVFDISSEMGEQTFEFPYLNFKYTVSENSADINSDGIVYSILTWGLWKSFFESFMQELYSLSQNRPVSVKQVGDDYTSRTQHLSREFTRAKPVIKISFLHVENNHLFLELDYLN